MVTTSKELELATHMTTLEMRRELAIQLYAQGKLSVGKARKLAEMTVFEFQNLLDSWGVTVNYGAEDFSEDLKTIQRSVTE